MDEYKKRMIKEYRELRDKYDKLTLMINKYQDHMLDFELNCDINVLIVQSNIMASYLNILLLRGKIEGIDYGS